MPHHHFCQIIWNKYFCFIILLRKRNLWRKKILKEKNQQKRASHCWPLTVYLNSLQFKWTERDPVSCILRAELLFPSHSFEPKRILVSQQWGCSPFGVPCAVEAVLKCHRSWVVMREMLSWFWFYVLSHGRMWLGFDLWLFWGSLAENDVVVLVYLIGMKIADSVGDCIDRTVMGCCVWLASVWIFVDGSWVWSWWFQWRTEWCFLRICWVLFWFWFWWPKMGLDWWFWVFSFVLVFRWFGAWNSRIDLGSWFLWVVDAKENIRLHTRLDATILKIIINQIHLFIYYYFFLNR